MKHKKRNIIICIALILLAVVFTIIVKKVDVKSVGPLDSSVGLSTINIKVFNFIGTNQMMEKITKYLLYLPILLAFGYAMLGLVQLIKKKSLLKVDRELIALGVFYIIVAIIYFLFNKFVINYRSVLEEGLLEPSYPSTHALVSIFIFGSSVIINKIRYDNKFTNILNFLSVFFMAFLVIGRLISGVHWFTDILGGILFGITLLFCYYTTIKCFKKNS